LASQEIDWSKVGDRIRVGLKASDLTQRELAKQCQVSGQTVTNWLNGKPIKAESLFRIAAALDLGVEQLTGLAPAPNQGASALVQKIRGAKPRVAEIERAAPDLMGLLNELEAYVRAAGS
jgi:transcriptional regulator with XRE-family HTH domain